MQCKDKGGYQELLDFIQKMLQALWGKNVRTRKFTYRAQHWWHSPSALPPKVAAGSTAQVGLHLPRALPYSAGGGTKRAAGLYTKHKQKMLQALRRKNVRTRKFTHRAQHWDGIPPLHCHRKSLQVGLHLPRALPYSAAEVLKKGHKTFFFFHPVPLKPSLEFIKLCLSSKWRS